MPDERDLEYLVAQVFESMPSADQSKLSVIERRLLQKAMRNKRQNNLNKIPWWIVLILAGGFATAAWWAGDLFIDKQSAENIDVQLYSNDRVNEKQSEVNEVRTNSEGNEQEKEIYENRNLPIIYQRESF
jgi:hypothetical protein